MGKTEIIILVIIFNSFFLLFILAVVLFVKQYKLKRKQYDAIVEVQSQEHQKQLLSNQIEVQQQTMNSIGQEIHDNIGQKMTLASLYTQQIIFENKYPQSNESLKNITTIINQSINDLRKLSKSLTDNSIENENIIKLINDECEKVNKLNIYDMKFTHTNNDVLLTYIQKNVLLRVTQEFIQNSIKHSKCKKIKVNFNVDKKSIYLSLEDDGIGFVLDQILNKGIGLSNMKKRTEILGGNFILKSEPNLGTSLQVILPLLQ